MTSDYLESTKKLFEYYKMLGEKTFAQLEEKDFFWQYNEESNSIGIIVKHLWGNMRSRWTDFLTSDGEKEWRNRDAEFVNDVKGKEELLSKWNEGWDCLFKSFNKLEASDLTKVVYIRNQGHTVVDSISRQLAHAAYHVGQIIYIGKMIRDNKWTSLSIPKGKSKEVNAEKFSQPKHKQHFTDKSLKE